MRFAKRLLASSTILIAGCSVTPIATNTPGDPVMSTVPVNGVVHGGQNPIVGASIYMFAIPTTGTTYGQASTSLLNSNTGHFDGTRYYVTTNASGVFTIAAGDYACDDQQVYLYSLGGNPQTSSDTDNPSAGLLAVLGECSATGSFPSITGSVVVNEATTVAAAYALSGFATDALDISASSTGGTGLSNAVQTAGNLVSLSSGAALTTTPGGNGTVPQSGINTLANILSACVNQTGGACNTLFTNAKNSSSVEPTDTATAAINIAHNPGANIANLWSLESGTAPFQPSLNASAPNDFTIAISYTGGGISEPWGLAVDASGDIYTSNLGGSGSISKFSPLGVAISPGTGFIGGGINAPFNIAVDVTSSNVWVVNIDGNTISEFSSGGTPNGSSGFSGGGLSSPINLAIDGSGNVWVTNYTTTAPVLSEFNSSGTPVSVTGYSGGGLNESEGVTVDGSGNIWTSNYGTYSIAKFSGSGSAYTGTEYTGGGLSGPGGIAIDKSGNIWAANFGTGANSISKFSSTGSPISTSAAYTGGGLDFPITTAVDGAGNVWVANNSGSSPVSEFNPSGVAISPSTGYRSQLSGVTDPVTVNVDGSGNVWVTDQNANRLYEFVGAGTPVVRPLSLAAKNNTLGQEP